MVRFTFELESENKTSLGLGISRENVNKLIEGLPIVVKLPDMKKGLAINGNILIYFGETLQDCYDQVKEFMQTDTTIHLDSGVDLEGEHQDKGEEGEEENG